MKIPRFRIGLRCLMLLVAISALLCRLEVRRQRFEALADYHASRKRSPWWPMRGNGRGTIGVDIRGRMITGWEIEWHELLADKYRRAARMPWIIVPPDPPRDEFRDAYRAWYMKRVEDGTLITRTPGDVGDFQEFRWPPESGGSP